MYLNFSGRQAAVLRQSELHQTHSLYRDFKALSVETSCNVLCECRYIGRKCCLHLQGRRIGLVVDEVNTLRMHLRRVKDLQGKDASETQ